MPVPFCTLSFLIFLRKPAGLLAAVGMYAVFIVALVASMLTPLAIGLGNHAALAAAVGGAIGGHGLALVIAVVHDRLFSRRLLFGAAWPRRIRAAVRRLDRCRIPRGQLAYRSTATAADRICLGDLAGCDGYVSLRCDATRLETAQTRWL